MALADPSGGAGRNELLAALARLQKQYAGTGAGYTDQGGARVLSDQELRDWLAKNPSQMPSQLPGAVFGANPYAFAASMGQGPPPGAPADTGGPGWGDGYGTAGWAASGANLFNPNLARGDMAMPAEWGGVGKLDNYGTPFWRRDFDPARPGSGKVLGEN